MDINKIVEKINSGECKLQDIANSLNLSKRTIQRKIKESGWTYDRQQRIYVLEKTTEEKKEYIEDSEVCNKTVGLTKETIRALRIKSVLEDTYQNDIVEEALRKFIEPRYFNIK